MLNIPRPHDSRRPSVPYLVAMALLVAVVPIVSTSVTKPVASPGCAHPFADPVADWNLVAYTTIRRADGYRLPLHASRAPAMTAIAVHDAVNPEARCYARYATSASDAGADPAAAAVVAAHDLLASRATRERKPLGDDVDVGQRARTWDTMPVPTSNPP